MPSEDDIRHEAEAVSRLKDALGTIERDLGWYWHWGDGEGGWLLGLLREAVHRQGYRWPEDERAPRQDKKQKIGRSLSRAVMERDAYRCVTCGTHVDLCCDHIVPESKGGPTTLENLQTMCRPCNSWKGNRE
jgi:5-methylcytosine-specific restriction endonuclease McrA